MKMPSLSELTDYDPMGNVTGVAPEADGIRRVYIGSPGVEDRPASKGIVESITNKLLGLNGEERYQLWPEKVVREGLAAAGDAMSGATPQWKVDPVTGDVHTSPQMIEGAQAMSALAGSGGLAGGTEGAVLNATPSLRPALKYKDRLYKGKEGQAHQDVIPDALYPEFQKMAMSGEDISHYNFGFVNDKGQFLTREKALEYGVNTGLIDPSAGKYGALTSTLLADSSKPGMAIEATAKANAPQFYSALEHNVNQISQAKMTGDQWLGTLANKPGVKPEELQWSGLKDYLEQNKGNPVSKEQIKSFLDENKTELEEKVYNQKSPLDARKLAESYGENWDEMTPLMRQGYEHEAARNTDATKYSQYQVPGGSNYRELLMALPDKQRIAAEARSNEITTRRDQIHDEFNAATPEKRKILEDEFDKLGKELRELDLAKYSIARNTTTYKSSHWDEPNILAHMRMNDRTIEGKKSLHLEEVQSDWHQDGRKKGYKGETTEYGKLEKALEDVRTKIDNAKETEQEALRVERDAIKDKMSEMRQAPGFNTGSLSVPDAPFKKNWHELALKRAIREAAENGYDRLSWTAGEHHPTNPKNLNQRGPEADAADKGMQGFYNGILPKSVEKLTGQKVVEGKLPIPGQITMDGVAKDLGYKGWGTHLTEAQKKEVDVAFEEAKRYGSRFLKSYYIDLPQSVKDTALGKGFPLFSSTHMFTPVAGNPFEDKK